MEGLEHDEDDENLEPELYELYVAELDRLREEKIPSKKTKELMDITRKKRIQWIMNERPSIMDVLRTFPQLKKEVMVSIFPFIIMVKPGIIIRF